ncbi:Small acidic protein 1 [Hibiscus syriacus]|uniref:Small acidic protein 1 n=1 Tax=Hibiscus syriacus TaxID=106335 RepID=A0A6A3BM26_HIBSY|nr:uncharacterized protein LOC120213901 [Hibiscus syriacus]KAE8717694.1 Small acidic protein 1 [Hibiscus syriacus]
MPLFFFTKLQKTSIHFPFYPPSSSHLRRRFSSSAARDSSSRERRKWDSNAETIHSKGFSFNTQQNDDVEEDDCDDEMMNSEIIDSIWIFKVFKSYGWTLPPILISLLFATGPKAFLMAPALPLGKSAITLAFKTISGKPRSKQKRNARVRKLKKYASRRTVRNVKREREEHEGSKNRKGMKEGYQSWTVDDNSLNESDQGTSNSGGWDELDGMGSMRTPSAVENGRQQAAKVKDKSSMEQSKSNEPLLLRLLIAVFPFLSSWTKLFW